jgi:hypothetical protein
MPINPNKNDLIDDTPGNSNSKVSNDNTNPTPHKNPEDSP